MRRRARARAVDRSWKSSRTLGTSALAAAVLCAVASGWAKVETWRQEGPTGFARAHREGVTLSEEGRVRLAHPVVPTRPITAERVWDLARTDSGAIWAATGDSGKVFKLEPRADASWTPALETHDSQVLALAHTRDEHVLAGTGPGGLIFDLADPKTPGVRIAPSVKYIWDLAVDRGGDVYAATGPEGQLWKRSHSDGRWSLLYDSKMSHLLCVAVAPDGAIIAGSDREGLIYRITAAGSATIVFDAPQSEVRSLVWGGDGALYAGTAAEAGPAARTSPFLSFEPSAGATLVGARVAASGRVVRASYVPEQQTRPQPGARSNVPGGSAAPRPASPGENAVYRFAADLVPREVFRVKGMIHAMAWCQDRLLVGVAPDGSIHEIRNEGADVTLAVKLDSAQILALLAEPDGNVVIGTGDSASVRRLSARYESSARLVSEVKDARLKSRFGGVRWDAVTPPGTSISVQCRSGPVSEPDETWSPWSAAQTDPAHAAASTPAGRYFQYRAILATGDPRQTPELRSISLAYRTINLAPEIARLDIPDLTAGDGAARQVRLSVRWDASDPNEDDLSYALKVRKDGWPDWIALGSEPTQEKSYSWDTTPFPSGKYRLKLIASDRRSNSPEETLARERESVPFVVDHDPPAVTATVRDGKASILIKDQLVRIASADYSLDGATWTPIFPDDRLFDALEERVTLDLKGLKPGVHVLMVRAVDAAGNTGSGDVLVESRP